MQFTTERFGGGVDTAISHALLVGAARGTVSETFRLFVPDRLLAFGRRDTAEPGFATATAAARRAGFLPLVRLAGGRAAVFHEATLAFSWTVPTDDPRAGVVARFQFISDLFAHVLTDLGFSPLIGETPGEYCPGRFSIAVDGRKVMGVGQRLISGAAHVGGVLVVGGANLVRDVLLPVYDALGLSWDPATTGDLPGVDPADVTAKVARLLNGEPYEIDADTRLVAARLQPVHLVE